MLAKRVGDVRQLKLRFGTRTVLVLVGPQVHVGEVHALSGPNGAGKTTLITILSGLSDPDSGKATLAGPVGPRRSVLR